MSYVVPIVTKLPDDQQSCMSVEFAEFHPYGARNVENARKSFIYAQVKLGCRFTYFHETNIHRTAEFHEAHVCSPSFCKERLNRISLENSANPFFAYRKS
jgi:hypothetical protein